ncbi:hypothetical protein [Brevundimonas sp.]|uniref:hypothetical protein n=1 Tax=Brevundimonas sp. TaxID=1871086 RepID=UPI0025C21CD3|nr:hypothetical protein [Brevundimonas sp.]
MAAIMGSRIPPMFEVGETYQLEWAEGGDHTYQSAKVIAWEAPLLKVELQSGERIINTASALFIGATERHSPPLDIGALLGGLDGR